MGRKSRETSLGVVPVTRVHEPRYAMRKPLRVHSTDGTTIQRSSLHMIVAVFVGGSAVSCPFACVAVCPPVYMSEEDALEVIRDAFAEEGVSMVASDAEQAGFGLPFRVDLAEGERRVAIEFVSKEDCDDFAARYALEEWLPDSGSDGAGTSPPEDDTCSSPWDGAYTLQRHVDGTDSATHFEAIADPEACGESQAERSLSYAVQDLIERLRSEGVI